MQQYNEDTIVEQLQDPLKCREAFAQVVAHYSEPLYWQIRKMVFSHDDADDLLQNTFLKAWNSIAYFRAEARLSTWLYRIAVNETITFLNKQLFGEIAQLARARGSYPRCRGFESPSRYERESSCESRGFCCFTFGGGCQWRALQITIPWKMTGRRL